ncbi:MAG: M90 family metallopeptidase [Kofleriaceae bacterium]
MFEWLTDRRRRKLEEAPFPAHWLPFLDDNVAFYRRLDALTQARLRDLTVVFIDEKTWEGCGGFELTEEAQVTIAAQACVLLLGREHGLYEDVDSILVYPSTMVAPPRQRGFFELSNTVADRETALHGQAWIKGPVILAWDDVLAGGRGHGKRNVVFHEFAHKIDMQDGSIDGTPPLDSAAARRAWAEVCSKTYLELRARVDAGQPTFLDDYGATNEAEFFAVATETYFIQPTKLREQEPALHALLAEFYRFEPPAR